MAVPKRKTSKSRKNKRRTHWKASTPTVSTCGHCGQPKRAHHVCPNCYYYGDRQVIATEEE